MQSGSNSTVQGGQTAPSAGGSSADGGALQPAAGSGLGSAPTDSTGLTAPTGNTLQAPATDSTQLQVLLGSEADGEQHHIQDSDSAARDLWTSGLIVGLVVLAAIIAAVVRHRQLARARARYARYQNSL